MLEPYKDMVELPEECELCVKEKDGKQYLFILNYDKESKRIVKNRTDMGYQDEVTELA